MKHTKEVILVLILLFLTAQLMGFVIIKTYQTKPLPYDLQPPEIAPETSFIHIFIIILIATGIIFLLAKFKIAGLWKLWFFLSVLFILIIAFSAFLPQLIATILALIVAYFKIIKRDFFIHNMSEVFLYGGLAALFIPILNIFSASVLLILISIYDMIAVWKTKHMIKLAKFQAKLRIFAGLVIPYGNKAAILGGGDIGFPLLFAGTVYLSIGLKAIAIPICAAIALMLLFIYGKKDKFYPAMPYITAGCFAGYLITLLI